MEITKQTTVLRINCTENKFQRKTPNIVFGLYTTTVNCVFATCEKTRVRVCCWKGIQKWYQPHQTFSCKLTLLKNDHNIGVHLNRLRGISFLLSVIKHKTQLYEIKN